MPGNLTFSTKVTKFISSKTKLDTFPWFFRVPQSKFEANWSRGFRIMVEQRDDYFIFIEG